MGAAGCWAEAAARLTAVGPLGPTSTGEADREWDEASEPATAPAPTLPCPPPLFDGATPPLLVPMGVVVSTVMPAGTGTEAADKSDETGAPTAGAAVAVVVAVPGTDNAREG